MKKSLLSLLTILFLAKPTLASDLTAEIAISTAAVPLVVTGIHVGSAMAAVSAPIWIPVAILAIFATDHHRALQYEDYIIGVGEHAREFRDSQWREKSPALDFFFIEYRSRIRAGQTLLPPDTQISDQELALNVIEWADSINSERKKRQTEPRIEY